MHPDTAKVLHPLDTLQSPSTLPYGPALGYMSADPAYPDVTICLQTPPMFHRDQPANEQLPSQTYMFMTQHHPMHGPHIYGRAPPLPPPPPPGIEATGAGAAIFEPLPPNDTLRHTLQNLGVVDQRKTSRPYLLPPTLPSPPQQDSPSVPPVRSPTSSNFQPFPPNDVLQRVLDDLDSARTKPSKRQKTDEALSDHECRVVQA